jgi:hypothetical protein
LLAAGVSGHTLSASLVPWKTSMHSLNPGAAHRETKKAILFGTAPLFAPMMGV